MEVFSPQILELAVESFFPQSYGTLKECDISKTIDLFDMAYGTKNISIDEP